MMRHAYRFLFFLVLLVPISACDQLAPPVPETAREFLVTAEVAFTQAVRLATSHKDEMSTSQVEIVDKAILAGDAALDAAEQAITDGNDAGAWIAAALVAVTDILRVLQ